MSPLRVQLDRIRRRLWLVLTITAVAVAGAWTASALQQTTYTGTSVLSAASVNRSPEQDSYLATAYVAHFNEPSYQTELRRKVGVADGITCKARTAATSPIVNIEAVADSPEQAAAAATGMAAAFRDDVNANLRRQTDAQVADINRQIVQARGDLAGALREDRGALLQHILALQDRITELRSNTTNELKDLQPTAGVIARPTQPLQDVLLALFGGIVLGCVLALLLAVVDNRLVTPQDVRERLGLPTLAVVARPTRKRRNLRDRELKGLANVVGLTDMRASVIAVASVRASTSGPEIAMALARNRAIQGTRTLLIRTDLRRNPSPVSGDPSFSLVRLLDARQLPTWSNSFRAGPAELGVLPAGTTERDPHSIVTPDRFAEVVQAIVGTCDLVVLDAPPVIEAAESQIVCATADSTIVVVDEGVTRGSDAGDACRLLASVHASVIGVVIVQPLRGAPRDDEPLQPPPPDQAAQPRAVGRAAPLPRSAPPDDFTRHGDGAQPDPSRPAEPDVPAARP